jgi:hypothetical protein
MENSLTTLLNSLSLDEELFAFSNEMLKDQYRDDLTEVRSSITPSLNWMR